MRVISSGISAAVAALTLAVSGTPAAAATVLNVNWGEGCGTATCFGDDGKYSQTFSSANFSGPVTIGRLLMQRGVLGRLDGSTFRVSFSLNGDEVGTWGHYNMSGINGEQLGFAGENFVWNPADGDLVLILALPPPTKAGGGGGGFSSAPREFAEGQGEGRPFGGPFGGPEGGGFGDEGAGPNGERGAVGAAVVPEPATWAMMIAGFGMAGAILRRRRTLLSA